MSLDLAALWAWVHGGNGFAATTYLDGTGQFSTPSSAPSGAAGGDLTGTYPNPTLAAAGGGAAGPIGSATVTPIVTVDAKGRVTALSSATISAGLTLQDAYYYVSTGFPASP